MKKAELDALLKRARVPEISEDARENFSRQVIARLGRNQALAPANWSFSLNHAWAFGLVLCVVLAFLAGHWWGQAKDTQSNDVLANIKIVRETLAMFPNHVRAIMEDNKGLNLILSDNDSVPSSIPIYVHICDGEHCASFVTFSGQEIQIGGQKVDVLSDVSGGIILTGNQFVWSSRNTVSLANHLKIQAKNLG